MDKEDRNALSKFQKRLYFVVMNHTQRTRRNFQKTANNNMSKEKGTFQENRITIFIYPNITKLSDK
jgi:hypothetical protein